MLARVAESMYWIARDVERADTYARLLEVAHAMTLERAMPTSDGRRTVWEPLVTITGDLDAFLENHVRADERSVVWFLSLNASNPNSVLSCVRRARRNSRGVRDLLPTELWEALNAVYLELRAWPPARISTEGVYPFCRIVRRSSYLIQGMTDQAMRRDAPWHFLRLGRFLERAEKTARLLEAKFHFTRPADPLSIAPVDLYHWQSLLRSAGADEAYLRMELGVSSPLEIARFLIVDAAFPRSINFCLGEVAASLEALADADLMPAESHALVRARAARDEIVRDAGHLVGNQVGSLMDRVQVRCNAIHTALDASCFALSSHAEGGTQYAQAARQAQN
jgi:uncharacterized alpha-E superfamily protein